MKREDNIEEIAIRYLREPTNENAERLIDRAKPIIEAVIRKVVYSPPITADELYVDLCAEMFIILQKYDPNKGNLVPYLMVSLRHYAIEYIHKNNDTIQIPAHIRRKRAKVNAFRTRFVEDHGREPSKTDYEEAGISKEDIEALQAPTVVKHFDSDEQKDCCIEYGATVTDQPYSEEWTDMFQSKDLREAILKLTAEEQDMLKAIYSDGERLKDYAERQGTTLDAMSKRHRRTLKKVQALLTNTETKQT